MGKEWAELCMWKHGQPDVPNPPANVLGQNLYMTTGALNLTSGIQLWFDEKKDFNYDTLGCTAGKMCGHYTQVKHLIVYISFIIFLFHFIFYCLLFAT